MLKSMSGNGSRFLALFDLGDQFQEEPQLADFHGLFHDVHAVEVVDDNGLQDEIAAVGMPGHFVEDFSEVGEFGWIVFCSLTPGPSPGRRGERDPSPPAPLPEGEGSKDPSPPAPLPEGEGAKNPSPPAPLPEGEGREIRSSSSTKACHSIQAGFVERFQDVESGEEEGA